MNAVTTAPSPAVTSAISAPAAMNVRTSRLLEGRIVPVMLSMAFPNVLVMLAQAATGLIETWFVSRLGLDALAGMALVFPSFMMVDMERPTADSDDAGQRFRLKADADSE